MLTWVTLTNSHRQRRLKSKGILPIPLSDGRRPIASPSIPACRTLPVMEIFMAHLLHRIPMGGKFLLTLLLPLLALAWFAGNGIVDRQRQATSMAEMENLALLSRHAGDVVHEMQRERGMTSGYLGSQGSEFGTRLATQRRQTDEEIVSLRDYLAGMEIRLDERLQSRIDRVQQLLGDNERVRQRVDNLDIQAAEAIGHYTSLNGELMTLIGRMTQRTEAASISRALSSYFTLLEAKDLAGIERAVLTNAFAANVMRTPAYHSLLELIGQEKAFL